MLPCPLQAGQAQGNADGSVNGPATEGAAAEGVVPIRGGASGHTGQPDNDVARQVTAGMGPGAQQVLLLSSWSTGRTIILRRRCMAPSACRLSCILIATPAVRKLSSSLIDFRAVLCDCGAGAVLGAGLCQNRRRGRRARDRRVCRAGCDDGRCAHAGHPAVAHLPAPAAADRRQGARTAGARPAAAGLSLLRRQCVPQNLQC